MAESLEVIDLKMIGETVDLRRLSEGEGMHGLGIETEKMYIVCDECGTERRLNMRECRLCKVNRENVYMREEVNALKEEINSLKSLVKEIRGENSVRSRVVGGNLIRINEREVNATQSKNDWVAVGNSKGRSRQLPEVTPLECSNRYDTLATEGNKDVEDLVQKGEKEVLLIGDSQVRYVDREFCQKNRRKRMRVCLPGARVNDINDRFDRLVKDSGMEAAVIVHVGVNDIRHKCSEEVKENYRNLIEKMKRSRRKCVISGVLPIFRGNDVWLSRAIGVNERVKDMCHRAGIEYLDLWDEYLDRRDFFAVDGLHLSEKGLKVLCERFESILQNQGN